VRSNSRGGAPSGADLTVMVIASSGLAIVKVKACF
jgi:hypothetical protein